MRIFLSFSSEQRDLANRIRLKLQAAGYDVFFDEEIKGGSGYDAHIRDEMAAADKLLFLASPSSLTEGRYTHTELKLAEQRWPKPEGSVLAVLVDGASGADLPPYLGAVTSAMQPKGDVASDVVAEVVHIWPRTLKRFIKPALMLFAIAAVLGLGAKLLFDAQALERLTPARFQARQRDFRAAELTELKQAVPEIVRKVIEDMATKWEVPLPTSEPPSIVRLEMRLDVIAVWIFQDAVKAGVLRNNVDEFMDVESRDKLRGLLESHFYPIGAQALTWQDRVRSPDSDEPLRVWFDERWHHEFDPDNAEDRRNANLILHGDEAVSGSEGWPTPATPRRLVFARSLSEAFDKNHATARMAFLVLASAGDPAVREKRGWKADHPVALAVQDAREYAEKCLAVVWEAGLKDADRYLVKMYKQDYVKP